MKLIELNEKEFKLFADKNPEITFHQTENWADLKQKNGWKHYYVGLKEKNKVIAATLLLGKELPIIKKYMFYAPRGFLIDYNNFKVLKEFTKEIKVFAKKKKGIFIKIDPYVEYQERDLSGDLVKNGTNNVNAHKNLISLG